MDKLWILPSERSLTSVFKLEAMIPIKITPTEKEKLYGICNFYETRRSAIDSVLKVTEELTIEDTWADIKNAPFLKWQDRTSLWQYVQSRLVILIAPIFICLAIPLIKFRVKQFKKYILKEYPEWWI